jgi:hypothetical protein
MKHCILFILLLCLLPVASYAQKKCAYDNKGPKEVPFIWMTNELDGGTLSFLQGVVTDTTGAPVTNSQGVVIKDH